MRVCIYGAGAIGGHLAARLAKSGTEVSVIARGAQLAAIQADGLRLEAHDGDIHCHPRASADAREIGPVDYVLVTTKAPSLPQVAAGIGPLLGPETAVAFIMNGIPWWYGDKHDGTRFPEFDPGDAIRRAVGVERTLGGVVYAASTVTAPGKILSEARDGRVILGELDGSITPRLTRLADAIAAGGIGGEAVADIRAAVWTKLLSNLMTGPLCTLSRTPMNVMLKDPAIHALATRMGEEVTAIATACGYPPAATVASRLARSSGIAHKPSILQDLEAGRLMEVESLWLAPLRLAAAKGVAVPNLAAQVGLCALMARAAGLYGDKL